MLKLRHFCSTYYAVADFSNDETVANADDSPYSGVAGYCYCSCHRYKLEPGQIAVGGWCLLFIFEEVFFVHLDSTQPHFSSGLPLYHPNHI